MTILNCELDSIQLKEIPLKYPVKKIEVVQSEESSQLSFLIDSEIESTDIEIQNNIIDIMLRTAIDNNANKITEIRKKWLIDTIVLDPGHGGKDPGNRGNGYFEKNIALNIALNVGEILTKNKVKTKIIKK